MLQKLLNWFVSHQLRPILINWKTTLLGLIALIPSLRLLLDDVTGTLNILVATADGGTIDIVQLKHYIGGIGTIIGILGVVAKDGNKSTEASIGETPPRAIVPLLILGIFSLSLSSCCNASSPLPLAAHQLRALTRITSVE